MRRRNIVALLLALAFGVGVYVSFRAGINPPSVAAVAGTHSSATDLPVRADRLSTSPTRSASQAPSRPPPGGPQPVSAPGQTSTRNVLPKVAPEHYDAGLRMISHLDDGLPNLVDRRPPGSPDIPPRKVEALRYGLQSLEEDISDCLDQWPDLPLTDGGVMIGFAIDAKGLHKSWVQSDDEIPFGPRTCLANAVYGIDWSNLTDQPAEVTYRYSRRAAGAPAPLPR